LFSWAISFVVIYYCSWKQIHVVRNTAFSKHCSIIIMVLNNPLFCFTELQMYGRSLRLDAPPKCTVSHLPK
jgi:hypothetical protein